MGMLRKLSSLFAKILSKKKHHKLNLFQILTLSLPTA
jgi:hypothetical protein